MSGYDFPGDDTLRSSESGEPRLRVLRRPRRQVSEIEAAVLLTTAPDEMEGV